MAMAAVADTRGAQPAGTPMQAMAATVTADTEAAMDTEAVMDTEAAMDGEAAIMAASVGIGGSE